MISWPILIAPCNFVSRLICHKRGDNYWQKENDWTWSDWQKIRILGRRTTADMIVYSEDKGVEIVLEFWEDGRGKALSSWEAGGGRKEGQSAGSTTGSPVSCGPATRQLGTAGQKGAKGGKGRSLFDKLGLCQFSTLTWKAWCDLLYSRVNVNCEMINI